MDREGPTEIKQIESLIYLFLADLNRDLYQKSSSCQIVLMQILICVDRVSIGNSMFSNLFGAVDKLILCAFSLELPIDIC